MKYCVMSVTVCTEETAISLKQKKDDGGVLCAVLSKYNSRRGEDLETAMEILWVEVILNNRSILIATVYLPHYSTVATMKLFDKSILYVVQIMKSTDLMIILGDFNRSDAKWINVNGLLTVPDNCDF